MPLYELAGHRPILPADGSAWVAPSADLIGDAAIGEGASVWFGTVVRADNGRIAIGAGSNIQDQAMLHSDPESPCTIGADVTIGHRAILHGCTIGDRVLIGMGAIVLNDAVIAEDCIVGAGALVTERRCFPAGSLILGAPAGVKRALSAAEIASIPASAARYRAKAALFATRLAAIG